MKGFSLIEVILAVALFMIFASGATAAVIGGLYANQTGEEQTIATQYASEGLEALRSIKNQAFANLVNSAGTGIAKSGGIWILSGANNTFEKYTRVLKIEAVQRDVSGNIVAAGGTADTSTKKITSTVSWNINSARSNSVELVSYLTEWAKSIIGNWAIPSKQSSLNLSGTVDGFDITSAGDYAYIIRESGTPNFHIINISNLATPVQTGSLTLASNPTQIVVAGNYAYVSSSANGNELQIVNISNPASPSIVGNFNASGNTDAISLAVSGNYVYLAQGSNLIVVNVSNPALPVQSGSISLTGTINDVVINGNLAYLATASGTQNVAIINISNPAAPSLAGAYNGGAGETSVSIANNNTTVYVGGSAGTLAVLNVSNPAAISITGFTSLGTLPVHDLKYDATSNYVFTTVLSATNNFRVVNVATPATPTILGSFTITGGGNEGLFYSSTLDRAFVVSNSDTEEFVIMRPN